ncbi:S-layer homology domain-containing protein [Paenibacillus nasutitermitis]|uniref:SLH domain-containing protein n=1 Tax=Paenibacillus nasutitermitis TaxID=1652958 RepID=A0A916ZA07_9BACL|nr:S-layer homology domain-containing protein [Paenibacillus nasutitermitis]GGD83060.1 hypothetical protein GCM10010911_46580 [Paenibacillus nasutitermitis]
MPKRKHLIMVLLFLLGCASFSSAAGALPAGDPTTSIIPLPGSVISGAVVLQEKPAVRWNYDMGNKEILMDPAVGPDGTLYVSYIGKSAGDQGLLAINPNGTLQWKTDTKLIVSTSVFTGDDGTVYVGTMGFFGSGTLLAMNPNGSVKWSFGQDLLFHTPPVAGKDGVLYVAPGDGVLYALHSADGSVKWSIELGKYSSISLAVGDDGTVYAANAGDTLYAIKPNGSMKWTFKGDAPFITSPAVGPEGVIYVGSSGGRITAVSPDGTKRGGFTAGGGITSAAVGADGAIYFGAEDSTLYALLPDMKLKWKAVLNGPVSAVPVIGADGKIYAATSTKKAAGSSIYAVLPSGRVGWKFDMKTSKVYKPAVGPGNTLYSLESSGLVYALSIPVNKIALNQSELALEPGTSGNLKAVMEPANVSNPKVIWSSTNPGIASVDSSGAVTAISSGKATITATAADNGLSAACVVTVSSKSGAIEVTSVKLNKFVLSLRMGESETLSATVIPTNAANKKVAWKSSKPSAVQVDAKGKVTALSVGTAQISVKTEDGEFFAACIVTVAAASGDAPSYADTKGNWAEESIRAAAGMEVAKGYPDGTFRPDANITRAEFTVMLMNGLKTDTAAAPLKFKDNEAIPSWAMAAVQKAVALGFINGYADGSFRPNANITHAELTSMVVKASGLPVDPGAITGYADDGDIPAWAKASAATAEKNGIIVVGGKPGNNFTPKALASRAEAVSAIVSLLSVRQQ